MSSDQSDDSPIHHLEITTPFLRPAPLLPRSQGESNQSSFVSAAVLATRARRPAQGLTEDWIRQHTATNFNGESQAWLSDGSGEGPSLLGGSVPAEEGGWFEVDPLTPRAHPDNLPFQHRPTETLTQDQVSRLAGPSSNKMTAEEVERAALIAHAKEQVVGAVPTLDPLPGTPRKLSRAGKRTSFDIKNGDVASPATPVRALSTKEKEATKTPRLKKKIPWKGKNIMVLLPRDDDRGKLDGPPIPLTHDQVAGKMRLWQEQGYSISGFDLGPVTGQSNVTWPSPQDIHNERARGIKVTLPDLNSWKQLEKEQLEAKLRALGVTTSDEGPVEPLAPSSVPSRNTSAQYPPQPFSPPIPTASAGSNHAFNFNPPFLPGLVSSGGQSPSLPSLPSPLSFNGHNVPKHRPGQSIAIPSADFVASFGHPSPHGWGPQQVLMQQGLSRNGSPSLLNLNAIASPGSPFQNEGFLPPSMPAHNRTQSLQYPMLSHQHLQLSARASPRLQDLREDDEEEAQHEVQQPTVRHNASDSLQKEIDEAESYHLEEQLRNQFEQEDYSPHHDMGKPKADLDGVSDALEAHIRQQSVQFREPTHPADDLVIHQPKPHSRGQSLSQKFFVDHEDAGNSADEGSVKPVSTSGLDHTVDESYEIETNPSNLGTPVGNFSYPKILHGHSFSTSSNPWQDVSSHPTANGEATGRRSSHASKPSLSKLNVEAPEFKFNPGQSTFNFCGPPSTTVFKASAPEFIPNPPAAVSGHLSNKPTSALKINVNAPVFAPGKAEFSFSTSGPKFRPDAPAFTPHSLGSPGSGNESGSNNSIFGNIDVSNLEAAKPVKKSKAIPIVRPPSRGREDADGRRMDESRVKRAKANDHDDKAEARFSKSPEPAEILTEVQPVQDEPAKDVVSGEQEKAALEAAHEKAASEVEKEAEDELMVPADFTTVSSTIMSEATESKIASSADGTSPEQSSINWGPFELKNELEISSFNTGRPWDDEEPLDAVEDDKSEPSQEHKALSATAKSFTPGVFSWSTPAEPIKAVEPEVNEFEKGEPVVESKSDEQTPTALEPSEKAIEETMPQVVETQEEPEAEPEPVKVPKGLAASRFATGEAPKAKGLAASRFAPRTPTPPPEVETSEVESEAHEDEDVVTVDEIAPAVETRDSPELQVEEDGGEPTFEEIDSVMRHLDANPSMGVNRSMDPTTWHQPSPTRQISITGVTNAPTLLEPLTQEHQVRDDTPSASPHRALSDQPILSTEIEDPFVEPPQGIMGESAIHNLNDGESLPASEWNSDFSDGQQAKFEDRVPYFDTRIGEVVGHILEYRLGPIEKTLDAIQHGMALAVTKRASPSRRERRSVSVEMQHSDADDEDEEPIPRRSMSPRRDRRFEQMRAAVIDGLNTHSSNSLQTALPPAQHVAADTSNIMQAIEEIKAKFSQSMRPAAETDSEGRISDLQARIRELETLRNEEKQEKEAMNEKMRDLEERLHAEVLKTESEITYRRETQDKFAELDRSIRRETANKEIADRRVAELEARLKAQEDKATQELEGRRAAEDRLSEVQRLLRISSEEELRLRELVEEKDKKIRSVEENRAKNQMRISLLEASHNNTQKSQTDVMNRLNIAEVDLRDAREEASRWKSEAERAKDHIARQSDELVQAVEENKSLQKFIDTVQTQLEEAEKVRELWRNRTITAQNELTNTLREVTEENKRLAQSEQSWLARQEILEARLQAEGKTRERIEQELARLESLERQAMRAVKENDRLAAVIADLQSENHKISQTNMRHQREFEEAREAGIREVQRTRISMQNEIDAANHEVNSVRDEFEDQIAKLRAQVNQAGMDADALKMRHEMLLEEAQNSKKAEIEHLTQKHRDEIEDMQTRFERLLDNAKEDAHRSEQNYLERLSLSTSKTDHLQERVAHLTERLEIANAAAKAAADAARQVKPIVEISTAPVPRSTSYKMPSLVPEKIDTQALRETIMTLQEQLHERERKIESLEQTLAKSRPDDVSKIGKQEEEISWLRELLDVRRVELREIVDRLTSMNFDGVPELRDALIRIDANIRMQEQERERAMNGGSSLKLQVPSIATIREATPKAAQAAIAAAWGNWRKGREQQPLSVGSVSRSSPSQASTPARHSPIPSLSGLLTPPASGIRQTPPVDNSKIKPAAFRPTGRRFTVEEPSTPPMHPAVGAYDDDAQATEDFDDNGFFDDE